MADKLDWLNKHLTVIRHITVADAVAGENYKIDPDTAEFFDGVSGASEMVFKLAGLGKYKHACELMAYIAHRRAGVWWGYRCLVSLSGELREKPPVEHTLEDAFTPPPRPPKPDWAVSEPPKPDPAVLAAVNAELAKMEANAGSIRAAVNPAMLKYVEDGVEQAFQIYQKANGIHPMELLQKLGKRMQTDPYRIDPNSPIFKAVDELKANLASKQAELKAEMTGAFNAVLPPKGPAARAHMKQQQDNALDAVYRWVVAPDAENSQKCLDAGNANNGTPEGLLAYSAFWSFGNLMPAGDQVIPTPPGLAANGLDKTLLMCAVAKGGTRKIAERYELYFNLGVDVLTGKDNWDESLAAGIAPHRQDNAIPTGKPSTEGQKGNEIGYHHWKTEVPLE